MKVSHSTTDFYNIQLNNNPTLTTRFSNLNQSELKSKNLVEDMDTWQSADPVTTFNNVILKSQVSEKSKHRKHQLSIVDVTSYQLNRRDSLGSLLIPQHYKQIRP